MDVDSLYSFSFLTVIKIGCLIQTWGRVNIYIEQICSYPPAVEELCGPLLVSMCLESTQQISVNTEKKVLSTACLSGFKAE